MSVLEPYYFGPRGRRLFGVYHPPAPTNTIDLGVLLCYPMGQEYLRAHRAYFLLARRLCGMGAHVLRFDYCGCGDSEGGEEIGDIATWGEDVMTAKDELRDGASVSRFCMVGARVGASIALRAAREMGGVRGLVLWDPVVDGGRYLEDLRQANREFFETSFARMTPARDLAGSEEILGFTLPAKLATSVEMLDERGWEQPVAQDVLWIDTQREAEREERSRSLTRAGCRVELTDVEAPAIWVKNADELGQAAIPTAVLDRIARWVSERLG